MSTAKKADAMAVLADLANDLKSAVARIESDKYPTTRGHYGKYMGILSMFSGKPDNGRILATALIMAGANKQGVADAFQVTFGAPL